jgi:hypothetical protein
MVGRCATTRQGASGSGWQPSRRRPAELVDVIVAAAGPMISALDDLAALPLDDLEPFVPSRRLPDDAP